MRVLLFAVAEFVAIGLDGRMTLVNSFFDLQAEAFPLVLPQLYFGIALEPTAEELARGESIRLYAAPGDGSDPTFVSEGPRLSAVPPAGGPPVMTLLTSISEAVFNEPGTYEFVLFHGEERIATAPIYVAGPEDAPRRERTP